MIKKVDTELREAIEEVVPLIDDVLDALLKHLNDDEKKKAETLTRAFEDLGIQYNVNFKVSVIKKTIDDLDTMLKELLETKV